LQRSYKGQMPRVATSAYIDPQAVVIGDVVIGEDSSVWPCAVIRGDVHFIRIGARTNIQDGSILHVMRDTNALVLGDDVTVGHSVTLHGCTIESRCLIGMGSIILNGAVIGTGSIIAAGTLVPERTIVPPGSLMMGQPAKLRRALGAEDLDSIDAYARRYVEYKETYRAEERMQGHKETGD
jgi:carbonic anhydrase/acetyltransferase-like protein (isoleucine patch superfamily)